MEHSDSTLAPSHAGQQRFLEIGHLRLVKQAFPAETDYIETTFATLPGTGLCGKLQSIGGQCARLFRAAFGGRYELIFCRCFGRFIYRRDMPLPVNGLRWAMGWVIELCVRMQVARGARLAVVDALDEMTIDRRDLALLRACTVYFKRELPQNQWNALLRVQPEHGEFHELTCNPAFMASVAKLAPLSLGIADAKVRLIRDVVQRIRGCEKSIDVFYAGPVAHSTVRQAGIPLLEELLRRGYRVEIYLEPLPLELFIEKMHRSWLVWSPEGQGWDCYRHYEACVAGSVPLMNHSGILRHQLLRNGEHCVEYAVEGDDLIVQAEQALANRVALLRMAEKAYEHVLSCHTHAQLGAHMVARMIGPRPA